MGPSDVIGEPYVQVTFISGCDEKFIDPSVFSPCNAARPLTGFFHDAFPV
jgi:hypothetical protein